MSYFLFIYFFLFYASQVSGSDYNKENIPVPPLTPHGSSGSRSEATNLLNKAKAGFKKVPSKPSFEENLLTVAKFVCFLTHLFYLLILYRDHMDSSRHTQMSRLQLEQRESFNKHQDNVVKMLELGLHSAEASKALISATDQEEAALFPTASVVAGDSVN